MTQLTRNNQMTKAATKQVMAATVLASFMAAEIT